MNPDRLIQIGIVFLLLAHLVAGCAHGQKGGDQSQQYRVVPADKISEQRIATRAKKMGCTDSERLTREITYRHGISVGVWRATGCGEDCTNELLMVGADNRIYSLGEDLSFDYSEVSREAHAYCRYVQMVVETYGIEVMNIGQSDLALNTSWHSPWTQGQDGDEMREAGVRCKKNIMAHLDRPGVDFAWLHTVDPDDMQFRWETNRRGRVLCARILDDDGELILFDCYAFGTGSDMRTLDLEVCNVVRLWK